jgi:hypothetical protein
MEKSHFICKKIQNCLEITEHNYLSISHAQSVKIDDRRRND